MSIDEIKPLLIVVVVLIGLVSLLAALRRNGVTLKPATGTGRLDPMPRMASANGAEWKRRSILRWAATAWYTRHGHNLRFPVTLNLPLFPRFVAVNRGFAHQK